LLDVDQFYGIEYEEFPAQIAQVAMWLMDHQMNLLASQNFGEYYVRLPLRKSATIVHGNALRIDWQSIIEPMPWDGDNVKFDYIMGNPPFIGSKRMDDEKRKEVNLALDNTDGSGVLDYVAGWYGSAAKYMQKSLSTTTAFVSTNSITQGEQVGNLWGYLHSNFNTHIHFAHQTFRWRNEAKGVAAVYCIVVGFGLIPKSPKRLFLYENVAGEAIEQKVNNINPYLVDGKNVIVRSRQHPICQN
jgi:hypothetical protein